MDFASSDFYSLQTETDPATGKTGLRASITTSLPKEVPLIVGDAIHNLRSALDAAISDAIFETTGKRSKWAMFPIRATKQDLETAVAGGEVQNAPKPILDCILNKVKPYRGGNDPLCALHELNVLDKHMLLLPMLQITVISGLYAVDDRNNVLGNHRIELQGNASGFIWPGKVTITNKGQCELLVLFDRNLPTTGMGLLPTLVAFSQTAEGIVESFQIAIQ